MQGVTPESRLESEGENGALQSGEKRTEAGIFAEHPMIAAHDMRGRHGIHDHGRHHRVLGQVPIGPKADLKYWGPMGVL